MEHGAAPLKKYTYLPHYQWYDLILLPGTLWVERISQLYPETKKHCRTVGYAKVKSSRKITAEKRAEFCQQFGFDASLPIVLFAPTWSDGDQERGIFNLNYFQIANVLTIPHDGDVKYAKEFQEKNYQIYCLKPNETISDYYHFADILVSDISSTAVEFAALGKPVICISTPRISDYDLNFKESDGRLRIPHTEYYWDFCQVVEREAISDVLKQIFETKKLPQMTKTQQDLVKKMVTYIGEEAVSRSADAIIEFVRNLMEKALYPKRHTAYE
jgi:CDP-glycerol glycerophosphotransferase (TagB/SpsB family)